MKKNQFAFQQFALDLIIKENERLKQENRQLKKQLHIVKQRSNNERQRNKAKIH